MRTGSRGIALAAALAAMSAGMCGTALAGKHERALFAFATYRGYHVAIGATTRGGSEDMAISLTRRAAPRATQRYVVEPWRSAALGKRARPGHLTAAGDLGRGRVEGSLGALGRISLRFHPRGRIRHFTPAGCVNLGRAAPTRRGTVSGTVRLHLGGGLGTMHLHHARAVLRRGTYGEGCVDDRYISVPSALRPRGNPFRTVLGAGTYTPLDRWAASAYGYDPAVTLDAERGERHGRYWLYGEITAKGPQSLLAVAPDLSAATVTGRGPWLTGSATFAGPSATAPGFPGESSGTLSGDLTARWDLWGDQPLTAAPGPTLSRTAAGSL